MAVIVCNVRTVVWSGKPIKVGFVYGLWVHEDYQRQGIGTALSDELETPCSVRGVSMLYLTVNNDNGKARALYSRLGYRLASERAVRTKFLIANEPVSDAVLVVHMVTQGVVADVSGHWFDDRLWALVAKLGTSYAVMLP